MKRQAILFGEQMDLLSKGPNTAITALRSHSPWNDSPPLKCVRCGATCAPLPSNEAVTDGGNPTAVVCSICKHAVCSNCVTEKEDLPCHSLPRCVSCVKPFTLTYLFRNTAFGPSLLADVAGYCDPQSERTLKFLFPPVALELARRQQALQRNVHSNPSTPRSGSTRRVDLVARSPSPTKARRKIITPPKHTSAHKSSHGLHSPRHHNGTTHSPLVHVSRGREREPKSVLHLNGPGVPISTTVSMGANQQHRTNSRYATPQKGNHAYGNAALTPKSGPRTPSSNQRPLSARVSSQTKGNQVGSRRATPDNKSTSRLLFRQRTADAQLASETSTVHPREGCNGHPPLPVARALLPTHRSPSERANLNLSGAGMRDDSPGVLPSLRSLSTGIEARVSANRFSSAPARIKTPRRTNDQKKRTTTPNAAAGRNLHSDGGSTVGNKHGKQPEPVVKSIVVQRGTPRRQTPRQAVEPAAKRVQKRSATAPRSRVMQRTNTYTGITSKQKNGLSAQPPMHTPHEQPLVPRIAAQVCDQTHGSVQDTDNSSHRTGGGISHRHAPLAMPPGTRAHHQYINKLLESGALGGTSLLKPNSGSMGKSTTGTSSAKNGSGNNKTTLNTQRRVKGKLPLARPKGKLAKPKGAPQRHQKKKESTEVEYAVINGELRALSPMRNTLTPMGTRDSDVSESPAPRFPSFSEYLNEGGSMQQSLFFDGEEPSTAGDKTLSSPIECGDGEDTITSGGGGSGPAKVSSVANRDDRQLERSNKEYFLTTSENRAGSNDEGAGRGVHGMFDANYVAFQVDGSQEWHDGDSTRTSSPEPVCATPETQPEGVREVPNGSTQRTATSATNAATFTRVDVEHTIHWAMLRKLSAQYTLPASHAYNAHYSNYATGATPPQRNQDSQIGDHPPSLAAHNATPTRVMRGPLPATPVASSTVTPLKGNEVHVQQMSEHGGAYSARSFSPSKPIYITPLDTRALSRLRVEDQHGRAASGHRPRGKSSNTDGRVRRGRKKDVKSPATKRVCSGPVGAVPSPFKRINSPLRRFNSQGDALSRQTAARNPPPIRSSPLKTEKQTVAGRRAVLSPLHRNQTMNHIQSRPLSARAGGRVTSPHQRNRPKSEDGTARHPSRFLSPATRGIARVTSPRKQRTVPTPLVVPTTARKPATKEGRKRTSLTGLAALTGRERGLIASHRVKDAPLVSEPLPLVRIHSSAAGLTRAKEANISAEQKKKKGKSPKSTRL